MRIGPPFLGEKIKEKPSNPVESTLVPQFNVIFTIRLEILWDQSPQEICLYEFVGTKRDEDLILGMNTLGNGRWREQFSDLLSGKGKDRPAQKLCAGSVKICEKKVQTRWESENGEIGADELCLKNFVNFERMLDASNGEGGSGVW